MQYGYARVSTQEQENHTQIDALRQAGVDFVFEEKKSGGSTKRPVLEAVLCKLQPGDIFVVYKLDRVARSLQHLLHILDRIELRGAKFRSLTESIDTTTPAGRMLMQMLGAFAEFELSMIRERTRAGIQAAMARGAKPGRPRALKPHQEAEVVRRFRAGGITKSALAREYETHISSIKRVLARAPAPTVERKTVLQDDGSPAVVYEQNATRSSTTPERQSRGTRAGAKRVQQHTWATDDQNTHQTAL